MSRRALIEACLIGGAIGDSIGLPYEGLSARRAQRWSAQGLRQCFVAGRGMISDDTDHTVFVAQALLRSRGDVEAFRRVLAWRLRLWLLTLPAGIGLGTLRGIARLWLGLRHSGVRSAGNGAAMRSALIGACLSDDRAARRTHVSTSALLTHADPRAIDGALAVAEVAARIAGGDWHLRPEPAAFAQAVATAGDDAAWRALEPDLARACTAASPTRALCELWNLGHGVSGYVMHSVPFALAAWFEGHGDYAKTISLCVKAGGDVDTNAAIAGALAAMVTGTDAIPREWRERWVDWPHSPRYLLALATALDGDASGVSTRFSPGLWPRNLLFLVLVLAHALRRALPPY